MRIAPFFVHLLFVFSSSARAARTVHCSFIVRSLFVLCSFFVRSLFVLCSSFVRLLFVFCSSFVRLLFVFCSSFLRLFFICLSCYDCPCGSHLSVWLTPACVARTAYRATTSHRFPFKACPPSGVRGLSSHRHLSLTIDLVFLALLALLVLN